MFRDKTWMNLEEERSLNGTGRLVDCVLFSPEQVEQVGGFRLVGGFHMGIRE